MVKTAFSGFKSGDVCYKTPYTLKADSHITCRAHAVPLICRVAKGLDCVFPIGFTQCGRVWLKHTVPCPCRAPAVLRPCRSEGNSQGQAQNRSGAVWARHGMCGLALRIRGLEL